MKTATTRWPVHCSVTSKAESVSRTRKPVVEESRTVEHSDSKLPSPRGKLKCDEAPGSSLSNCSECTGRRLRISKFASGVVTFVTECLCQNFHLVDWLHGFNLC